MMTSRSEYRLLLRQDNADRRLTPYGYACGLVSQERYARFLAKMEQIDGEIERLEKTYLGPDATRPFFEARGLPPVQSGVSLADLLRRPDFDYESLSELDPQRPPLPRTVRLSVSATVKYAGYIRREQSAVDRRARLEDKRLSPDLDYLSLKGLRLEAAQKLDRIRPLTVGQASRISGVNPADITVLLIHLGLK
jgi:tRNA uridine 5-carboxymethylaminomethyl modification enzyme